VFIFYHVKFYKNHLQLIINDLGRIKSIFDVALLINDEIFDEVFSLGFKCLILIFERNNSSLLNIN